MNIYKIIFPIIAVSLFVLYLHWRKRTIALNEFRRKYEEKYTPKYGHEVIKFKPHEVLVQAGRNYRIFWMSKSGKWHSKPITYRNALEY